MSWFWTIVGGIIVGAIIGALARLILPGRQNISAMTTVVAGVLAAVIGGLIAQLIGVGDTKGVDWIKLIIQIVLAVIFVSYAAKRFPAKGNYPAPASGRGNVPPTYRGTPMPPPPPPSNPPTAPPTNPPA